jgi:hypothetical protein
LYFIEFDPRQAKEERDLMVALAETGMILESTINIDPSIEPDRTEDVEKIFQQSVKDVSTPVELFKYYATTNQVEKIDTIIRRVVIDTTVIEDVSYESSMVYKTIEQRASEAADFIVEIRENRFNLLTGYQEVNYSKEAIQYMDDRLVELESDYLSLFRGKEVRKSLKFSFNYIPGQAAVGSESTLFRFDETRGAMDASASTGQPVSISMEYLGLFSKAQNFEVLEKNQEREGFYYRIPAHMDCKVFFEGRLLEQINLQVNQLGAEGVIPVADRVDVKFYPNSGSVRKIILK